MSAIVERLLHTHPITSRQIEINELRVLLEELRSTIERGVVGAVVEFGCYSGTTAVFVRRLLDQLDPTREMHVYDSFVGLPPKTTADRSPLGEQFVVGELSARKSDFIRHFRRAHLALPVIHKGWFEDLDDHDVPSPIAFAFLDGDYYRSIAVSLRLIEQKLSPDATIIVDDYNNQALPGARQAVDEWHALHRSARLTDHVSLAIIRP